MYRKSMNMCRYALCSPRTALNREHMRWEGYGYGGGEEEEREEGLLSLPLLIQLFHSILLQRGRVKDPGGMGEDMLDGGTILALTTKEGGEEVTSGRAYIWGRTKFDLGTGDTEEEGTTGLTDLTDKGHTTVEEGIGDDT